MVLDPQRRLELRRFRGLVESGAMSLPEVAKETGLNWRTVSKYLSADSSAPPRELAGMHRRFEVFFDCHRRAFAHFNGVPMTIVHDRTKTVVRGHVAPGAAVPRSRCVRRRSDSPATTTSTSTCRPPTDARARAASNARC
jgi:transposase